MEGYRAKQFVSFQYRSMIDVVWSICSTTDQDLDLCRTEVLEALCCRWFYKNAELATLVLVKYFSTFILVKYSALL